MKDLLVKIQSINENELMEMVRAFEPYINFSDSTLNVFSYTDIISENKIEIKTFLSGVGEQNFVFDIPSDHLLNKKYARRFGKITIYKVLKEFSGEWLPYGCLTGVRPTKLYAELLREGIDAESEFQNVFDVTPEKTNHVKRIVNNQRELLKIGDREVDVFVNIPFCPTRCAYCSFVAVSMKQLAKYLEKYVECLKYEITIIKNTLFENNLSVRAVYFGGGTPTSIPIHMLESLIKECNFNAREFTVEAGRPDTITDDFLAMMQDNGVTRISINPQTFHDKTLRFIGRAHTVDDTLKAYELTKKYHFIVNMDLISALPGESFDDLKYSVDTAISLNPDNITVHNLSLKRGSRLTESNYEASNYQEATQMIDYSVAKLESNGYEPYYMYRQKYNTGNLENSGYAKPNKECLYNIDIMEENCTILAAGAGAISKRLYRDENRIERMANIKDVKGYIERAEEMQIRHEKFWKNI